MNGWFNVELIPEQIAKVKRFIAEFQPKRVNIFSFAIWDQHQRERFTMGTRPHLEKVLGVPFNLVLSVDDDIIPICCREMNIARETVDFQEMSNFWGKQGAFRLCMRHHAKNMLRHGHPALHAVLLDDVVHDEVLTWNDRDCKAVISQLNIYRLYADE